MMLRQSQALGAGRGRAPVPARSTKPSLARSRVAPRLQKPVTRAIDIDFTDADTQLGIAGIVLGLVAGIGAPLWYISRTERDEERLEELRAMNRANYSQTGEYMTEEEIAAFRKPKWTDRREFVDDD